MPGITQDELRVLAEAYLKGRDASGTREGQAMAKAYADRVQREFRKLKQKIHVEFTERDPYRSHEELAQDVVSNKRMYVFTGFSDTPLWSPEVNWMARAVHDYDHVATSTDFSLGGEMHAFQVAAAKAPLLEPMFLSEIALQAAVQTLTGSFAEGPQKLVLSGPEATRIAAQFRRNDPDAAKETSLVWDAAGALRFMSPEELMMQLGSQNIDFKNAVALVLAAETAQDLSRGGVT
jgi:hypothetical protein